MHTHSARGNMSSALDHAPVIKNYLKSELEAKHILGSFPSDKHSCPIHISPISIIPKWHQQNKLRLIGDMSSPNGASINNNIHPSISHISLVHVYPYSGRKSWSLVKGQY